MIIAEPPRHGKSRTGTLFSSWLFGHDRKMKIMTGSYNEILSQSFSKSVRDLIMTEKADQGKIVFSDIFPDTRIKKGDGALNRWSLEGGHSNYLATSPTGTATGFGADLLIVDDIIKNSEEAHNEALKEKHWAWFADTMLSRLEGRELIIIIMTRWATDDLAGRAIEELPKAGYDVKTIILPAQLPDGSMLCEDILSAESLEARRRVTSPEIVAANYQQEPIDIQGRLYSTFRTYSEPPAFAQIRAYTDTADTGADYLCSFVYGVTWQRDVYILDALYSHEPMEITEPATAEMMIRNDVDICRVESNNGGRGFCRNVERITRQMAPNMRIVFKWFHQAKNKQARIYSNSAWVNEHVFFPEGWHNRWPELYRDLSRYLREGKNAHDDAPDALTGTVEYSGISSGMEIMK